MKVAAFPNPSGSRYWRLADPFKYLRLLGMDAQIVDSAITDEVAQAYDVFVLQNIVDKAGIALLRAYQQERGKKIVVDADDLISVLSDDNPYSIENKIRNASEVIQITMGIADLITVTNNALAKQLSKFNSNIAVLPNYMDMDRWDLSKLKNTSDKIRIGWVGSITHIKDLELIVNPLKRIMDEFPQVQCVFMGDLRVKSLFEGYPVEVMLGVPFEFYPAKLHGLRLDIGLAPLVKNEFNVCKSNIKWQEYSICKTAGVYSPTVYQHPSFEPNYGLVAYDEEGWYGAIKHLIQYPDRRLEIAENAYSMVKRKYNLKREAHKWREAYQDLFF